MDVSVKNLDELNKAVDSISQKLTELNTRKKTDWISIVALVISAVALGFTIYSDVENTKDLNRFQDKQRETQAYTAWQNFLSTAINYPDLANGMDSIKGKVTVFYTKDFSDSSKKAELRKDTAAYSRYLKYCWFVAYALGSAEDVYNLQKSDTAWQNTLIEALGGHEILLDTAIYPKSSYDNAFRKLIIEAVKKKRIN